MGFSMNMNDLRNRRVLIIDDDEDIHRSIRRLLAQKNDYSHLDSLEAGIFDDDDGGGGSRPKNGNLSGEIEFQLDSAFQGLEGVEWASRAIENEQPYALAFVDIRMPPGIDGLKTIQRLWSLDPNLQIVVCSAYSDYSWDDFYEQLGNTDNLVVLKKPFAGVEVRQLASAMTEKWNISEKDRQKLRALEEEIKERKRAEQELEARTTELSQTNQRLQEEIEERSRVERELSRLNTELERRVEERTADLKSVIEELESFSYTVSHDLRAPLRSIDGFSHALAEDYNDVLREGGNLFLERILAACGRMDQLIEDLLRLSRIRNQEMLSQIVDLSGLVRDVVSSLSTRENESREMEIVIAPDISAECDERYIRIVIENLLGNAWKYTGKNPPERPVRIEFGCLYNQSPGDFPELEVRGEVPPIFFVKDNGVGFSTESAQKIFATFQRLHDPKEFEGSGVGLATCRRIIQRHGGQIWARGEPDKGATVYFTLLLKEEERKRKGTIDF